MKSTVILWDAVSGALLQKLDAYPQRHCVIAFSQTAKQLALASDKYVKRWGTSSGTSLQTVNISLEYVYTLAFSPDNKQLALASDDSTVTLWDVIRRVAIDAQRLFRKCLHFSLLAGRQALDVGFQRQHSHAVAKLHSFPLMRFSNCLECCTINLHFYWLILSFL
jgi:WD40 repeat protein